jgi:hypothetical protein
MARPHELVPGNCYFLLNYHDDDLKVPAIDTYIFEREAEAENGERRWLFRDPQSYSTGDDSQLGEEQQPDAPVLMAIHEDQLYQILDLAGLIKSLGTLVHLHPLLPLPPVTPASLQPRADFPELDGMAEKLLGFKSRHSVTMGIRYTDNGFSFGCDEEGLFASFFPWIHREVERESEIRAVFANLGIRPREDYLSQHGRVRVLTYPLPAEQAFLKTLAEKLLIDVYEMRQDDGLELSWNDYSQTMGPKAPAS